MQGGTRPPDRLRVRKLGHVGLYVRDLVTMRDFYRDVVGLTVTDEDLDLGFVFFSSRPDEEHHELVLQTGRTTDNRVAMVQQVSWHVGSVEELQTFHHRFKQLGIPVQQEVTHGNAIAIYFFDPETNRNEVYYQVKEDMRQPVRKTIDLELQAHRVLAESRRLVAETGPRYQAVTARPA